jgi:hypothetical protein
MITSVYSNTYLDGLFSITILALDALLVGFAIHALYSYCVKGVGVLLLLRRRIVFMRDWLIDWYRVSPTVDPIPLRKAFDAAFIMEVGPKANHTHGLTAALRGAVRTFAQVFGDNQALPVYAFQRTKTVENQGTPGSHAHLDMKDLPANATFEDIPADNLIFMVDVDHKLDMCEFLTQHFQPVLINACVPRHAGFTGKEYSYCFDKDNFMQFSVTGGGLYRHKVWNYGQDMLCATYAVYGIPFTKTFYYINRKYVDDDHELILLTPYARFAFPGTLLVNVAGCQPLEYLSPVVNGDSVLLERHSPNGIVYSIGRTGMYASTDVTAEKFATALLRAEQIDGKLSTGTFSPCVGGDLDDTIMLLAYVSKRIPARPAKVFPIAHSTQNYQKKPEVVEDEAKPKLVPFMSPFIAGSAHCPMECVSNEQACIQGRVDNARSPTIPIDAHLNQCMNDFAARIVPKHLRQTGVLMAQEECRDRLPTTTQRASWLRGTIESKKKMQATFMKAETNIKFGDPRNVTNVGDVEKGEYAQAVDPFYDAVVPTLPWYAFGKTPCQIADRVVSVCIGAQRVRKTDFERLDGHACNVFRDLERRTFILYFNPDCIGAALATHSDHFNVIARGKFGTIYNTGFTQMSGDKATSLWNTIRNAFTMYYALRCTINPATGLRYTDEEAWDFLCAKFVAAGDDGLIADLCREAIVEAAKRLGQVIKAETVERDCEGVSFLARVYGPGVFSGDPNSCTDLGRMLRKWHVTHALPGTFTPIDKLVEKALSTFACDAHTPIIGPFVSRVVFLTHRERPGYEYKNTLKIWNSQLAREVQYPNYRDDWMDNMALELLGTDYKWFEDEVSKYTTLEQCLTIKCLKVEEPLVTTPTIVNGDVVVPEGAPPVVHSNLAVPLPIVNTLPGAVSVGTLESFLAALPAKTDRSVRVVVDRNGIAMEISLPATRTFLPVVPEGMSIVGYYRPVSKRDPVSKRATFSTVEFTFVLCKDGKLPAAREPSKKPPKSKSPTPSTPPKVAALSPLKNSPRKDVRTPPPAPLPKPRQTNDKVIKLPLPSLPLEELDLLNEPLPPLPAEAEAQPAAPLPTPIAKAPLPWSPAPFIDATGKMIFNTQPLALAPFNLQQVLANAPVVKAVPSSVASTTPSRAVSSTTTDVHASHVQFGASANEASGTERPSCPPPSCAETFGTDAKTNPFAKRSRMNWSQPLFPRLMHLHAAFDGDVASFAMTAEYARLESRLIYYLHQHLRNVSGFRPYDILFWEQFKPTSCLYEYACYQKECITMLTYGQHFVPYLPTSSDVDMKPHIQALLDLANCSDEELDAFVDGLLSLALTNELYVAPDPHAQKRNHSEAFTKVGQFITHKLF